MVRFCPKIPKLDNKSQKCTRIARLKTIFEASIRYEVDIRDLRYYFHEILILSVVWHQA